MGILAIPILCEFLKINTDSKSTHNHLKYVPILVASTRSSTIVKFVIKIVNITNLTNIQRTT